MKIPSRVKNHQVVARNSHEHKVWALEAAKSAKKVLPLFEKERPNDDRPRKALGAISTWAQGKRELSMAEVRKLSLDSHAAARATKTEAARFAARAAGQAIAVWHVPTHALGSLMYARKAVAANSSRAEPGFQKEVH